ncbi:LacI family DNA-binding transcriptional regulator [Microbacterium sp. 179-I 3D3 NHS]|uniref:LacI family DNA-binding transcriptional regulator n=1 Tax=unclassified Microbacterium TaxID=2609290 RepID=UPI0039A3D0C7
MSENVRGATSVDVAARAGVSQTTVSLVFRGGKAGARITEKTRDRVLKAAAELDYRPNHAARSLRQSRSMMIGMVLNFYSQHAIDLVMAGRRTAAERGYQLLSLPGGSADVEASALDLAARGVVDALVFCTIEDASRKQAVKLAKQGVPMVIVGLPSPHPLIPSVRIDLVSAGFMATSHLIDQGHSRVGFLAPPGHRDEKGERYEGYVKAVAERGAVVSDALVAEAVPNYEGGYRAATRLLQLPLAERPTALFAFNDDMAIGAIRAAKDLSMDIPGDIALIGCNGYRIDEFLVPQLSTVRVPGETYGIRAVDIVVDGLNGRAAPARDQMLPLSLEVRESSVR